ncbi:MAG: choice-of-anchor Q domain-containing protein [Cyanobacteriota bacterium]
MSARKIIPHSQKSAVAIGAPLSLIFTVIVTLAFTSEPPAFAAGIVGNGTPGSCTEAALNSALVGGGNIYFNCGPTLHTIPVTSEKVISTTTVIDGSGLITLSGGGQTRIFFTQPNVEFVVKNLTLADGFTTDQGGAIFNGFRGKLQIINSNFNNNISTKEGKFDGGGAIYSQSESTVMIEQSTFTGNKAGNGGAINNLLSDLTIINSTFTGNQSVRSGTGGGGGAIYIDGGNGSSGKILIRGSTFMNNTAVLQGGAIFSNLYNNNTNTIEYSTFSGNSVTGTENQGFGGAIYNIGNVPNTLLTVANTTIAGNTATNQGAGIWSGNNSTVNIVNSTIFGNQAVSLDGKSGLGGGIMRTGGTINITNSTIASNYAGFQGGGMVGGSAITITNVILANNVANNGGKNWNIKNNCASPMTSGGNNIQFPARNLNDPNDADCAAGIITVDPLLGLLANNGGSTQTLAPLPGSPAINTGNNTPCPAIDQRGVARPQGGICDIGAVEVQ